MTNGYSLHLELIQAEACVQLVLTAETIYTVQRVCIDMQNDSTGDLLCLYACSRNFSRVLLKNKTGLHCLVMRSFSLVAESTHFLALFHTSQRQRHTTHSSPHHYELASIPRCYLQCLRTAQYYPPPAYASNGTIKKEDQMLKIHRH